MWPLSSSVRGKIGTCIRWREKEAAKGALGVAAYVFAFLGVLGIPAPPRDGYCADCGGGLSFLAILGLMGLLGLLSVALVATW